MTVEQALACLARSGPADAAVVVLRMEGGAAIGAPVTAITLDEHSQDASLVVGQFTDDEDVVEGAMTVGDARDLLGEVGEACASWPLFATDGEAPGSGGSIIGWSADEETEIFAFLQGPRSAWDEG